MNTIACIFARGGSKGLPGKNILPFCGKPLIAWSIEAAIDSSEFNKIYVSTDSEEIAEVAIKYGADVPFIRPSKISQDDSPEWDAWRHLIQHLVGINEAPGLMVSLPATSPLRDLSDISACINVFRSSGVDAVISIAESKRNPSFNMVQKDQQCGFKLLGNGEKSIYRRQDAPIVYDITTVAYAISPLYILRSNSLFSGKLGAIIVPEERAIDIDTAFDFKVAEYLFSQRIGA